MNKPLPDDEQMAEPISKELLQNEYETRFSKRQEYRNKVWKVLTKSYFRKIIGARNKVLDLGCGWGEFINNIDVEKKYAMDLNPQSAEKLTANVVFFHQDCSQTWPLADNSLDVVFTSNFFEHLTSKESLNKTLAQAHRTLKPGGIIICMGPNIRYLGGAYWDFWDHYIPLTDSSMVGFLEINNFIIKKRIAKFLPYTMSADWQPPLLMLRIYLRMRLAWNVFGRQFLVIAEKR